MSSALSLNLGQSAAAAAAQATLAGAAAFQIKEAADEAVESPAGKNTSASDRGGIGSLHLILS